MKLRLIEVKSGNPFKDYPKLRDIWPAPMNKLAEAGVLESLELRKNREIGGIFLIAKDNEIIGITGYYPYARSRDMQNLSWNLSVNKIGLRWHGIVNEHRGNHYSKEVINLVIKEALNKFENAEKLIELVPMTKEGESIMDHFDKLGFVPYGTKEKYDWADHEWQPYSLNIGMNNKPKVTM